jgi:hypothetical protein
MVIILFRNFRATIPEDLNRQSGAKQLWPFLARERHPLDGSYAGCAPEELDHMDWMRNYQFEEEYDGSAVVRPTSPLSGAPK